MAQRLSSEERARIEAMRAPAGSASQRRRGASAAIPRRSIESSSATAAAAATTQRRRKRPPTRARARPKTPVLAADPGLAAAVAERLAMRWSPHAVCADLRAQGRTLCAETIYRACYDHSGSRGLPEGSWRLLPRRCRRRKPRGRCTRKPSPLGDFRPVADPPGGGFRPPRGRALGGRSDHRQEQPLSGGDARGAVQPPDPRSGAARRLRCPQHRRRGHRRAGPPAQAPGQDPDLGHSYWKCPRSGAGLTQLGDRLRALPWICRRAVGRGRAPTGPMDVT